MKLTAEITEEIMEKVLQQLLDHLREGMVKVNAGLKYSDKGALCPVCDKKTNIYSTDPIRGGTRVRYHYCRNRKCLLSICDVKMKSVQVCIGKLPK